MQIVKQYTRKSKNILNIENSKSRSSMYEVRNVHEMVDSHIETVSIYMNKIQNHYKFLQLQQQKYTVNYNIVQKAPDKNRVYSI